MEFEKLTLDHSEEIISLASEGNPDVSNADLRSRLIEMFGYSSYTCFGLFVNSELVGITSGWLTTRFYSGKQLEIDNVIVGKDFRSSGYGAEFLGYIEAWAIKEGCFTVELNTYVTNSKSHKFYFNKGYNILGYHFQKAVNS
ncbi:MAG: GNAT family N-acetyltransferase [Pseudomonadales bacterium]|nr:GNAT family N-acetyltransferase [Pseudomonadales bacterium]